MDTSSAQAATGMESGAGTSGRVAQGQGEQQVGASEHDMEATRESRERSTREQTPWGKGETQEGSEVDAYEARSEEVGGTQGEARVAREEGTRASSVGSEEPTQRAGEAMGSARERGERDGGTDSEDGSETGVVGSSGSRGEGRVNAHKGGTQSMLRKSGTRVSEEEGTSGRLRWSTGPATDKRDVVGEDGGAPHTPRRSEEAADSSEEECRTREQHAEDGSSDDSDMERAPASWERVVPRPVHKGTEHHGVKAGYGGRARKGNSKPGGYDETPTRRGPQRKRRQMERIRYVEDERRKGGSLEQMIEVGRVSVHRTEEGRRTGEGTAATPPHDPG